MQSSMYMKLRAAVHAKCPKMGLSSSENAHKLLKIRGRLIGVFSLSGVAEPVCKCQMTFWLYGPGGRLVWALIALCNIMTSLNFRANAGPHCRLQSVYFGVG